MKIRQHVRIVRRSWVQLVLLTLVGTGAAAAISLSQTAQYSATARVFVSGQSAGAVADSVAADGAMERRVQTYADLASTPLVLSPVISELELDGTIDQLAARVKSMAPRDIAIIDITVTDSEPIRAAETANAISRSLTAVVSTIETPGDEDAVSPVKLTQAQEATAPSNQETPNLPFDLAVGGMAGLALGIMIAALLAAFETRIRNEQDVAGITNIAILGGIVFDPKAQDRPLIVHVDPRSQRAESFRTLRTNLRHLDVGRSDRSFVITSSTGSEGKSTTGANLAIALAQAGSKVLLVDADLRRPKVAEYMGIEGAVGLTELLTGTAELDDVLQPWGRAKLFVLPAGRVPPNPSELLGSARMEYFVQEFGRMFDVVIYDTPPLLPVTDAAILAKLVGGAIIVVAAGRTRMDRLNDAITVLADAKAPVSGLILTMLPANGPDASGYARSDYGSAQIDEVASHEPTRRERTEHLKRVRIRR